MGLSLLLLFVALSTCTSFNKTAYYIVWAPQLDDPSFPQSHLANNDVYVIQPANFTRKSVEKLRSIGKGPRPVVLL